METLGFIFGLMGFIFGMAAISGTKKLVKELKEKGVLDDDYKDPDLDSI